MATPIDLEVDAVTGSKYIGEEEDNCIKCGRPLKGKLCTLIDSIRYVCADDFENCLKFQKLKKSH